MMDKINKIKNGFLPPVVSTHAAKGIRSREPDNDGVATSNPSKRGSICMASLNMLAVDPNKATDANPKKNPSVAPNSPLLGSPFISSIFTNPFDFINLLN